MRTFEISPSDFRRKHSNRSLHGRLRTNPNDARDQQEILSVILFEPGADGHRRQDTSNSKRSRYGGKVSDNASFY